MTSDIVPLDAVVVAVVEDGEAGLVVELLVALQGQAHRVAHALQLARLDALEVVGLGLLGPENEKEDLFSVQI